MSSFINNRVSQWNSSFAQASLGLETNPNLSAITLYRLITGKLTATDDELKKEVDTLKLEVESNNQSVTALKLQVQALQLQVSRQDQIISDLTANVDNNSVVISKLESAARSAGIYNEFREQLNELGQMQYAVSNRFLDTGNDFQFDVKGKHHSIFTSDYDYRRITYHHSTTGNVEWIMDKTGDQVTLTLAANDMYTGSFISILLLDGDSTGNTSRYLVISMYDYNMDTGEIATVLTLHHDIEEDGFLWFYDRAGTQLEHLDLPSRVQTIHPAILKGTLFVSLRLVGHSINTTDTPVDEQKFLAWLENYDRTNTLAFYVKVVFCRTAVNGVKEYRQYVAENGRDLNSEVILLASITARMNNQMIGATGTGAVHLSAHSKVTNLQPKLSSFSTGTRKTFELKNVGTRMERYQSSGGTWSPGTYTIPHIWNRYSDYNEGLEEFSRFFGVLPVASCARVNSEGTTWPNYYAENKGTITVDYNDSGLVLTPSTDPNLPISDELIAQDLGNGWIAYIFTAVNQSYENCSPLTFRSNHGGRGDFQPYFLGQVNTGPTVRFPYDLYDDDNMFWERNWDQRANAYSVHGPIFRIINSPSNFTYDQLSWGHNSVLNVTHKILIIKEFIQDGMKTIPKYSNATIDVSIAGTNYNDLDVQPMFEDIDGERKAGFGTGIIYNRQVVLCGFNESSYVTVQNISDREPNNGSSQYRKIEMHPLVEARNGALLVSEGHNMLGFRDLNNYGGAGSTPEHKGCQYFGIPVAGDSVASNNSISNPASGTYDFSQSINFSSVLANMTWRIITEQDTTTHTPVARADGSTASMALPFTFDVTEGDYLVIALPLLTGISEPAYVMDDWDKMRQMNSLQMLQEGLQKNAEATELLANVVSKIATAIAPYMYTAKDGLAVFFNQMPDVLQSELAAAMAFLTETLKNVQEMSDWMNQTGVDGQSPLSTFLFIGQILMSLCTTVKAVLPGDIEKLSKAVSKVHHDGKVKPSCARGNDYNKQKDLDVDVRYPNSGETVFDENHFSWNLVGENYDGLPSIFQVTVNALKKCTATIRNAFIRAGNPPNSYIDMTMNIVSRIADIEEYWHNVPEEDVMVVAAVIAMDAVTTETRTPGYSEELASNHALVITDYLDDLKGAISTVRKYGFLPPVSQAWYDKLEEDRLSGSIDNWLYTEARTEYLNST